MARWSEGGWKNSWSRQEKVYNTEERKKLLRTARNCHILHMPMEWMNYRVYTSLHVLAWISHLQGVRKQWNITKHSVSLHIFSRLLMYHINITHSADHPHVQQKNGEKSNQTVWNWPWYSDDVSQHHYKSHGINKPETKKPMAVHYSCAPDDGCCDVRNMLS
jgi:hypothetical protein